MTVIPLPVRPPHSGLGAADDAQRMLLCCALRDAAELRSSVMQECPGCQNCPEDPGGPCAECWAARQPSRDAYWELSDRLSSYDGRPYGWTCPLDDADRQLITTALSEAIIYRQLHPPTGAEHHVLLIAYRELQRHQDINNGRQPGRPSN